MEKNLTNKEKITLLKNYLDDDIMFKAIRDTLSEEELGKYIDTQEIIVGVKN